MTTNEPDAMNERPINDDEFEGEVIYSHEKSLEEVLGEITGKDPEEIRRRTEEMSIPEFEDLVLVRKE